MKTLSILGFIGQLHAIDRDLEILLGGRGHNSAIVTKACQIIQRKAASALGKEHDEWAPLAPSTLADKEAHGWPVPSPLRRSGALSDSIEYVVRGNEGAVGSDDQIAKWQELGTSRVPPRSWLVSSAIASEEQIQRMAGRAIEATLAGRGRHASEVAEIFDVLREGVHVYHSIQERIDRAVNAGDDEQGGHH